MIKSTLQLRVLLILALAMAVTSCHTQKKISAGQALRNLTAYYNGYFNAKEIYKQDLKKIELANPDHFDRLLAFYKLGDEASAAGLASDMNQVILKCSGVIARHERSDWVSASYLLMGKAYYLKGDYYQALENFQFVYNNFKDETVQETGLIWAARAYMKLDKPEDAQASLDLALGSGSRARKKNADELYTTAARYYLDQGDTVHSVEMMRFASLYTRMKSERPRYYFIRAQLASLSGQNSDAAGLYRKVLSAGPGYNLAFGARLGLANISGETAEITKDLKGLLNDEKNLDYKDQIYYALGNNYARNKDYKLATENYRLSLKFNSGNTNQRALSYEQLGEIFLNINKEYTRAAAYYDSTMNFLDKDYPGYTSIKKKQSRLGTLVSNYKYIDQQDTLLMLAALDTNARKIKVRSIVDAEIKLQHEAEMAAIAAYKKQIAASSSRFAAQSAAGSRTGNGLNGQAVQQNSFLQTTSGTGMGAMSTYQPSSSNQMQIYAQGASNSGSASSGNYGGGAMGGSYSSGPSAGGSYSTNGANAFGGTPTSGSSFGSQSGTNGTGSNSFGNSTPVYTNSSNQGNSQGGGQGNSQGGGQTPQGGAGLYGGTSFNTVGSGGGGGGMQNSSAGSMPAPGQQGQGNNGYGSQNGAMDNSQQGNGMNGASGNSTFIPNTATTTGNTQQYGSSAGNTNGYGNGAVNNNNNQAYGQQGNNGNNQAYGQQGNNGNNQAYGQQGNNGNYQAYGQQGNNGNNQANGQQGNNSNNQANPYASGGGNNAFSSFYFANPQAMSQGFVQFVQLWGNRPLRDNWRRGTRSMIAGGEPVNLPDSASQRLKKPGAIQEVAVSDPHKAENAILRQVPSSRTEIDSITTGVLFAYATIAGIYEYDLADLPKAISTYETLLEKFAGNKNAAQFYFELYKLYTQQGNTNRAAFARSQILKKYPETVFADFFLHPEKLIPKKTSDPLIEAYYDSTYQAYQAHHYNEVLKRVSNIPKAEIANYLEEKFEYLKTLSIGYTRPLSVFEPRLKALISTYSGTESAKEAAFLLKAIDSNRQELAGRRFALEGYSRENGFELAQREADRRETAAAAEKARLAAARKKFYSPDLNAEYQLIVLFNSNKLNLRPVRLGLSQFAAANFANLKLSNSMSTIAGKVSMLVGVFHSFKAAMTYYKQLMPVREDVLPLRTSQYEYFVISNSNLSKLTDTAKLQIYREFFDDNYAVFASSNAPEWPSALNNSVSAEVKKEIKPVIAAETYAVERQSPYLLIIAVNSIRVNLNPVRLQISIFNQSNFGARHLSHQTRLLNNEALVISVNTFNDLDAAQVYYKQFMIEKPGLEALNPSQYQIMLISKSNYSKLRNLADLGSYLKFFNTTIK